VSAARRSAKIMGRWPYEKPLRIGYGLGESQNRASEGPVKSKSGFKGELILAGRFLRTRAEEATREGWPF